MVDLKDIYNDVVNDIRCMSDNQFKEELIQACQQAQQIRNGELPKRTWKQLREELHRESEMEGD